MANKTLLRRVRCPSGHEMFMPESATIGGDGARALPGRRSGNEHPNGLRKERICRANPKRNLFPRRIGRKATNPPP
jgi:hypothetical protein